MTSTSEVAPNAASDGIEFHRPARAWPMEVSSRLVQLPAPPLPPSSPSGGRWARLLPLVGSVAMIGFAFVVHSIAYLVIIGCMVVGMVGATLVTSVISTRDERRRWQVAHQRYHALVIAARAQAMSAGEVQRAGLAGLYPSEDELVAVVAGADGIWERRPGDPDFGWVRLGSGRVRTAVRIEVADDGAGLRSGDPELEQAAADAVAATAWLEDAPVTIPLCGHGVVTVVGEPRAARGLAGAWLASLAAFHAPGELRFAGWVPPAAADTWDWIKWLPHCRDVDTATGFGRARRSLGADLGGFAREVEALVRARVERAGDRSGPPPGAEHVVVLVDGWKPRSAVSAVPGLDALFSGAAMAGVTVVVLVERPEDVPSTSDAVVRLEPGGKALYVEAGPAGRVEAGVVADHLDPPRAVSLGRRMAPLRLEAGSSGVALGDNVRLVELLGAVDAAAVADSRMPVGLAEAATGDPRLLCTPIGRRDDSTPVELNLREAAQGGMGPHGILVGATGSGKSELLRSIAAGLAAGHQPELLNLLLIDYKGGAAFAGLGGLPHVAGLVTNLADDPGLITRVRQALVGELERRQRALAAAGDLDSIGDYHRLAARTPLPDLPYMVLVVDEFGELLAAEPDFVEVFNAIGRLGRSLGMHLLLATQRLDEGRIRTLEPHLRYRLGLRTYSAAESRSIIGSAAAYELPPLPGLGYLAVDGRLTRFKASIATLPYRPDVAPADPAATEQLRPFSLQPPPEPTGITSGLESDGRSELQVLVDGITAATERRALPVWLPPLPERVTLGELDARRDEVPAGAVALGLVDLPAAQAQVPLTWDLAGEGGNLGVAGAPRAGVTTVLTTAVAALARTRGAERAQFYCLDLGGGGLAAMRDLPHVGAVVGPGEPEGAARVLAEVTAVLDQRSRNGDRTADNADVWVVVDGVGILRQTMPDLDPVLTRLAIAGPHHGVHVLVGTTRWWDVRPQLLDALGTKLELRLGDPGESLGDRAAARQVPAGKPGRGVTRDGHAFQAALPAEDPDAASDQAGLAALIADCVVRAEGRRAPGVLALPERVTEADLPGLAALAAGPDGPAAWDSDGGFLLGVSQLRAQPVCEDLLGPGAHLAVYGDAGSGRTTLLTRAARHLDALGPDRLRLHVVDPAQGLLDVAEMATVANYAVTAGAAEKLAIELADTLSSRLPSATASIAELRRRPDAAAVHDVLVVDDYDLLLGALGGPFTALVEILGQSARIGLHVVAARRVAGLQRSSFEPFAQRLRELRPLTVILPGTPDEGPVAEGVVARPGPPGRATVVARNQAPRVLQCLLPDTDRADR